MDSTLLSPRNQNGQTMNDRNCFNIKSREGFSIPLTHVRSECLKKLPYDFHYRYRCQSGTSTVEYRHKIVDWEAGALYWNCKRKYGAGWEEKFREKMEQALPAADLIFLMGTIHRFPDQWLIVSLIYPPKRQPEPVAQPSLFDR